MKLDSHLLFVSLSGRFGGSERDSLRRAAYFADSGYKVSYFYNHIDIHHNVLNHKNVTPILVQTDDKRIFEAALNKYLDENKVTHMHNSTASLYYSTVRLGKKHKLTKTSFFFGGSDLSRVNIKRIYALNSVDSIIINSPTAKKNIEKYIIFNKNKTHLVLNMISPPKHDLSHRDELNLNDKIVIGFCGGLNGHKGADYLIPTLKELKKFNTKKIHLLMAGDGPMRELIQTQAKEANLEKEITFLGHINDISKFYNSVDIFLLSSRDEGMANVLFEAMVHKCKIVSTNVNGVDYALKNGQRGVIVPPNNPLAMAKALDEVINKQFSPDYLEIVQKEILEEFNERNFYEKSLNAIL